MPSFLMCKSKNISFESETILSFGDTETLRHEADYCIG